MTQRHCLKTNKQPPYQASLKGNPGTTSSENAVPIDKQEEHLRYHAFLLDVSPSPPFPIVPTSLQDHFCLSQTDATFSHRVSHLSDTGQWGRQYLVMKHLT